MHFLENKKELELVNSIFNSLIITTIEINSIFLRKNCRFETYIDLSGFVEMVESSTGHFAVVLSFQCSCVLC